MEDKISFIDFEKKLNSLSIYPKKPRFAVALSGGADSLCLAFLLHKFLLKKKGELVALIVDHKLREESTKEAKYVQSLLEKHNIKTIILTRKDVVLTSRIQEQARFDRYRLLLEYCKDNHFPYLFLGHHLGDNLETFIMRKKKGSNIIGDAAISSKVVVEEAIILRPLLFYSKKEIINTIRDFKVNWVEDPSNNNLKYQRIAIRRQLEKLPLDVLEREGELLDLAIKKRYKKEQELLKFLSKNIVIDNFGKVQINMKSFNLYDKDIIILAIRKILKFVSASLYMVNISKVENFLISFQEGKIKKVSLGKCIIEIKKDIFFIYKEDQRVDRRLKEEDSSNKYFKWDNRFLCESVKDLQIKKVLLEDYQKLKRDLDFQKFLYDNNIKFSNINTIPWYFNNNEEILWDVSIKKISLRIKESIFMSKFI